MKLIKKLPPLGGGDDPEDVAGGLDLGLKMDWKSKAKYAVLIGDAPAHGLKYNNLVDNYPNGDPYGLDPEDLIRYRKFLYINKHNLPVIC